MEQLRCVQHAPGVQMQEVPSDFYSNDEEEEQDPDVRETKVPVEDREYYDDDYDNDDDDLDEL